MSQTYCIAEGFATAASIHDATGYPTVVAFNAGNLLSVARSMRALYPTARLVICADDDFKTSGNPGVTAATLAARAVEGELAIPSFGSNRPKDATDLNDLAVSSGPDAVRQCVEYACACTPLPEVAAATVAKVATVAGGQTPVWQDPLPLTVSLSPMPYPINALPKMLQEAVQEGVDFVKAPTAIIAGSALASISIAIQPMINVRRARGLVGPVSLYLLCLASSGERKSTGDKMMTAEVREFERAKKIEMQPEVDAYDASKEIWQVKKSGLKEKIKKLSAQEKPTAVPEIALRNLEAEKPEKPQVPRLLYSDVTPEALSFKLATVWDCAGVVSAEAGVVFGGHGMSSESAMRNLAQLNVLWDGGDLMIDRKTTDSFMVTGARLTMSLQVQESTLQSFMDRAGTLARGTGFFARFLFAAPESTQGGRLFSEASENGPAMQAFNQRLYELLNMPYPRDENGRLDPIEMALSVTAKQAWVAFHDGIETQLGEGGQLRDVRDVASKAADNAARLAAIFEVFENGVVGEVSLESFQSASQVVAWHLNESRRFFGESDLPPSMKNAAKLDGWLIKYCRDQKTQSTTTRKILQFGPSGLRDKAVLQTALRELQELGRVHLMVTGKHCSVEINPMLLQG